MARKHYRIRVLYIACCRIYQRILQIASYFVRWRKPELLEGPGSLDGLPDLIYSRNVNKVLVVTDHGISSLGLLNSLLRELEQRWIQYAVYDKTASNPTIGNIEEAFHLYLSNQAEAIIALGGGSSIDCAKGVGARVACPGKSTWEMRGLLKVRKRLPLLIAVPTTAGTGSEVTIAAVVLDAQSRNKFQINDIALIPEVAVLDPLLTIGLPAHLTSTTGMDALTHAIEAYIGKSNTQETRCMCRKAVGMVFDNILTAYTDGKNLTARSNMLKASHYAGIAFTRAYIGYVHAISHTLGGVYGISHGFANAIVLPYVLEYYGKSIHSELAELADIVQIDFAASAPTQEQKATAFIGQIRELNRSMNIPDKVEGIDEKDIPLLTERALKEANPFYPVPKILFKEDLNDLFRMISGISEEIA